MKEDKMPKLLPLPIKTKGRFFLIAILVWLFSIRKWRLQEDWYNILPNGQRIVIPKGFEFDGASIPRPAWAILSPVGLLMLPGLVHDYAYKHNCLLGIDRNGERFKYREGAGKLYWDKIFRQVAIDINGFYCINTIAWFGLFIGGFYSWYKYRWQAKAFAGSLVR